MADETAGRASAGVFRLIYRSRDRIPRAQRKTELGTLFSVARSNNKSKQISGALLVADDWFVQALEGDEALVRELFAHITRDTRHDRVSVIEEGVVDQRVFPRWAMAQVAAPDAGGEARDTYLIAHEDGIAPAADRPTTPAQDAVLGIMRQCVHGGAAAH